jgi:hypothetical protein
VIANDLTARRFIQVSGIPAKGDTTVRREDLLKADGNEAKLLAACAAQWRSSGMTEAESQAIVETWRPDILDRPGLLMISRMPTVLYDQMFPLTITPRPDELVRVGMVFDTLAGQPERIAWVALLKARMEKWGQELSSNDYAVRQQAFGRLAQAGDLARELLEKLSKSGDTETKARATALLEQLQPGTIQVPHLREGRPSTMPSGR